MHFVRVFIIKHEFRMLCNAYIQGPGRATSINEVIEISKAFLYFYAFKIVNKFYQFINLKCHF